MDFKKKCFRKVPAAISKVVDSETIVLPLLNNVGNLDYFYSLNSVASRIWELINGKRSMVDIERIITKEFEVGRRKVGNDVISFLEELEKRGWIKEVRCGEKEEEE